MKVPETPKLSVGEKISAMLEILKGSSNREVGDILKAVAAINNLRVVSAERSFAQPQSKTKVKDEAKTKQRPKVAVWKTQEWETEQKEHQVLVQAVKESDEANRPGLILRLRDKESSMKLLKKKLQGKGSGAPQGGAAAVIATALAAIAEEEEDLTSQEGYDPSATVVDTTGLIARRVIDQEE
jgi:hypothetical protein